MCILIFCPVGTTPPVDHLTESCEANPDGFGFAVIAGDRIITGHSMIPDEAIQEFLAVRAQYPDGEALFHARITTHGTTSLDNCHPFYVGGNESIVLAHNGMLPCQPKPGDLRSDTRIFAEDLFMNTFPKLDRPKTIKRMSSWVGYSKVLILSVDKRLKRSHYLINESMGHWNDGIWYSNSSYEPWVTYRYPTTIGGTGWAAYRNDEGSPFICRNSWCGRLEAYCGCLRPDLVETGDHLLYVKAKPDHVVDYADPDTWACDNCQMVGWIGEHSMRCGMCGWLDCCQTFAYSCECWEPSTARTPRATV